MAKILLQFPEGLKTRALELARDYEKKGDTVIISADACWGACDIKDDLARSLGCDKLVHIGHTQFIKSDFPIEYVEMRAPVDADRMKKVLELGWAEIENFKNFGLLTSIQYLDYLEPLKKLLEARGKKVFISSSKDPQKIMHGGQTLGCDVGAAGNIYNSVDCFLFVGSGKFHPLGADMKQNKPVFAIDLTQGKFLDLEPIKQKFLKQKFAAIGLARHAKKFGILVSSKKGQFALQFAEAIKKKLQAAGREAFIIVLDEISDTKLMGLEVDCWINTACPRIAIEDRANFSKPLIGSDEVGEVLK